jgi:hypothetical protein
LELRKKQDKRDEFLFLSIWFVFIFLFFTLSTGKKDNYLLPLYPAAALMVGRLWDSGLQSLEGKRGFIPGLILLTFLFLAGFVLFLSGIPQKLYPVITAYQSFGLSILFYLAIGPLLSLFFFIKKKRYASLLSLVVSFAIFHIHISYALPLKLNEQRSLKAFSQRILRRMKPGDELKTIFSKYNGLIYYTKRPYIEEIENWEKFYEIFRSRKRVFIVLQIREFETAKRLFHIGVDPIERMRVGHWELVLISNR